jgi:hypothetical protein
MEVRQELERRGHEVVSPVGAAYGGYQNVLKRYNYLSGNVDPVPFIYEGATEMRKDGNAAGY